MSIEEIVDLAVVETAEGTEVTARLVRLADWESRGEWRREWRVGGRVALLRAPRGHRARDPRPRNGAGRAARGMTGETGKPDRAASGPADCRDTRWLLHWQACGAAAVRRAP